MLFMRQGSTLDGFDESIQGKTKLNQNDWILQRKLFVSDE